MSRKLSKKDQLSIIEQLQYGPNWPQIRQTILNYQYSISPQINDTITPKSNDNIIVYQIGSKGQKFKASNRILQLQIKTSQNYLHAHIPHHSQNNQLLSYTNRYFLNNSFCINCHNHGHQLQLCPYELRCLFCLSPYHKSANCQNKQICLLCYEIGHNKQNCTKEDKYHLCNICERYHLPSLTTKIQCYSIAKGNQQKKNLFPSEWVSKSPQIMCIKCNKFGHLSQC